MPLRLGKLGEQHIVRDDSQRDSLHKEVRANVLLQACHLGGGLQGNSTLQPPENTKPSLLIRENMAVMFL